MWLNSLNSCRNNNTFLVDLIRYYRILVYFERKPCFILEGFYFYSIIFLYYFSCRYLKIIINFIIVFKMRLFDFPFQVKSDSKQRYFVSTNIK